MQTDNIKRPALIEPFFNLEIDFKNDYVEYISTTNQSAVTPQSNISKIQHKNLNTSNFEVLNITGEPVFDYLFSCSILLGLGL